MEEFHDKGGGRMGAQGARIESTATRDDAVAFPFVWGREADRQVGK